MKRVLMGLAAIAAMTCIPQTTSAQSAADLTLVHGIPGTTVDLSVDGTVVIDAFVPGSLANISSFAGQTLQNVTVTDEVRYEPSDFMFKGLHLPTLMFGIADTKREVKKKKIIKARTNTST